MADRERNVAIARDGIEAFGREDAAAVAAMLHPEVETVISRRMVNPGTWQGLDGFREGVSTWTEAWRDLHFDILEMEAVDDRHVLAHVHQRAVGRESGVPVEMDAVLFFEFEDGRARRFQVHPDREAALAAV